MRREELRRVEVSSFWAKPVAGSFSTLSQELQHISLPSVSARPAEKLHLNAYLDTILAFRLSPLSLG